MSPPCIGDAVGLHLSTRTGIPASLLVLGLILGAEYAGGPIGVLVLLGSAMLLAAPFGAVSNAIALMSRRQESLIGVANFVVFPLTFLSTAFMAEELVPGWVAAAARYNPVTWAVDASREAMSAGVEWGFVGVPPRRSFISGTEPEDEEMATLRQNIVQKESRRLGRLA